MDKEELLNHAKAKLDQAAEHFNEELKKLRTGRAHPSMLDGVMVEAYGQSMPLKSVASITVPEPQLLQLSPFDPNNIESISEAIRSDSSLGLTPSDDGRVVRVNLPPMTEQNRQDIVKVLHQKLEETMVSARNARHESLHKISQAEKDKQLSRDEASRLEKQIDELLTKQKKQLDDLAAAKEKDIMTL